MLMTLSNRIGGRTSPTNSCSLARFSKKPVSPESPATGMAARASPISTRSVVYGVLILLAISTDANAISKNDASTTSVYAISAHPYRRIRLNCHAIPTRHPTRRKAVIVQLSRPGRAAASLLDPRALPGDVG